MPIDVRKTLRNESRLHQKSCQRRPIPKKHKYVYILGRTKKETKALKQLFVNLNSEKNGLPYPKIRGPQKLSAKNLAGGPLTMIPEVVRPTQRWVSVKDAGAIYGVSIWTMYELIKTDPSFPYRNIGIKKKFVLNMEDLEKWMKDRTKKEQQAELQIPSAAAILALKKRLRTTS